MLFRDPSTRLIITAKEASNGKSPLNFQFKSYLEKSDVQVKFIDNNIQYAPLNFTNNTQLLKTQYTVDFSFNVFSEDRDEAFSNYDQLHQLLKTLKPSYIEIGNQLLPKATNIFGLITIKFAGLPLLTNNANNEMTVYVTNFSYDINKEIGFIHAPYNPILEQGADDRITQELQKRQKLYVESDMKLVPIAYKLNISGKVLQPLEELINKNTQTYDPVEPVLNPEAPVKKDTGTGKPPGDAINAAEASKPENKKPAVKKGGSNDRCTNYEALAKISINDPDIRQFLITIAEKFISEEKLNKLSCSKKQSIFKIIYDSVFISFIMTAAGDISTTDQRNKSYESIPYAAGYFQEVQKKYNQTVDKIKKISGV